jgi:putative peptidoglycan lipid II flippase
MSSKKSRSLLSAGLSLSFFTLCSRILGLVREMTKAAFLGTSKYADAFGIAFMIPNLLRRLFAENAISVAFIPTFKGYLEDGESGNGKKTIRDFLSATITLITFLTTCVVLAGILLTPLIVRIFLDNNDSALLHETTILTRIMFPYLVVISIAAFFQGVLNGVKIFSPSGFTPVLFNSVVIAATYILTPILTGNIEDSEVKAQMAARAMSIGVISGGCVQALFQLPFVLKTGWRFSFTTLKKAFTNPGTRRVMKLIVPTIIGMAAYQLNDEATAVNYLKLLCDERVLDGQETLYSTWLGTLTGDALKEAIIYNWRVEMWGEGYSMQMLRRLQKQRTLGTNHLSRGGAVLDITSPAGEQFQCEIPTSETRYNPNIGDKTNLTNKD